MTLLNACNPPKHSKWHVVSGLIVVMTTYTTTIAVVTWWLA